MMTGVMEGIIREFSRKIRDFMESTKGAVKERFEREFPENNKVNFAEVVRHSRPSYFEKGSEDDRVKRGAGSCVIQGIYRGRCRMHHVVKKIRKMQAILHEAQDETYEYYDAKRKSEWVEKFRDQGGDVIGYGNVMWKDVWDDAQGDYFRLPAIDYINMQYYYTEVELFRREGQIEMMTTLQSFMEETERVQHRNKIRETQNDCLRPMLAKILSLSTKVLRITEWVSTLETTTE
jgi:hypothetical protein